MLRLKRLGKQFYQQKTFTLAPQLLGKYLIRRNKKQTLIGQITECEVYYGHHDLASHAAKGKTARTALMFGQPGRAYIYLIYGMYHCFNIVTEPADFPAAILIRAVKHVSGLKQMFKNRQIDPSSNLRLINKLTNGPGKFCQAFKIDKKLNGENLITSHKLYLASNPQQIIKKSEVKRATRIGIEYAGTYKNKPWRYFLKEKIGKK